MNNPYVMMTCSPRDGWCAHRKPGHVLKWMSLSLCLVIQNACNYYNKNVCNWAKFKVFWITSLSSLSCLSCLSLALAFDCTLNMFNLWRKVRNSSTAAANTLSYSFLILPMNNPCVMMMSLLRTTTKGVFFLGLYKLVSCFRWYW